MNAVEIRGKLADALRLDFVGSDDGLGSVDKVLPRHRRVGT